MSLYRLLLLRSLRQRSTAPSHAASYSSALSFSLLHPNHPEPASSLHHSQNRTFAFSSAEEAAAERRRRKRRLRIEPPLHALRRDNYPPPPRDPNAPRLPDSTSALVGPRLNLHNRVQSLIRAGDLDAASAVARHSVFSNTRPTVFTCNAIIASMYRAKRYTDAIALFQFFYNQSNIVPNVVSYNNLINAHCDMGNVDTALEVYRHVIANAPFSPSSVTYRHLTKGLIDVGRIDDAVDLLREMLNRGGGADSLVYNNLISGFLKLGNLEKANELFDELKSRCMVYDGVVNATYMDWFFNQGRDKEAMESYKSLLDRQFRMVPATCNVLIEVLLKHSKKAEAWAMFEQMLDNHTPPNFQAVNSDTFNLMVNECFKNGLFDEAIAAFRKVGTKVGSRPFSMDVAGYTNIITRYCEQGMLTEADTLFKELVSKSLSPDVGSHRALIEAYLKAGQIDDALIVFHKMVDSGLRVVASFGNRVFEELIRNGKAVDCGQILTKMGDKDPKPDATCYEVVIRGLCGDAGALDAALDMIGQVIKYGVGMTPSLREFLIESFRNAGRGEELERQLSMDRWGNPSPRPQVVHRQVASPSSGPNQFNGASPMMTAPPGNPQAERPAGPSQSPMFGTQARQPDMAWQQQPGQFQVARQPPVGLMNGRYMAGPAQTGEQPQEPQQQVHGLSSETARQSGQWGESQGTRQFFRETQQPQQHVHSETARQSVQFRPPAQWGEPQGTQQPQQQVHSETARQSGQFRPPAQWGEPQGTQQPQQQVHGLSSETARQSGQWGEPQGTRQFFRETQQPQQQVHGQWGEPQGTRQFFRETQQPQQQVHGQWGEPQGTHQFFREKQQPQQQVHGVSETAWQYGGAQQQHVQDRAWQYGGSQLPPQMNEGMQQQGSSVEAEQVDERQQLPHVAGQVA